MDVENAFTRFESALDAQLALAGADPAVEQATAALRTVLRPALRELAVEFAEQAAAECAAQLPGHDVSVVVRGGEPELVIRPDEGSEVTFSTDDLEARLTLRLPPDLKSAVERAASDAGDSINTHVIRLLSQRAASARNKAGKRIRGTVQT